MNAAAPESSGVLAAMRGLGNAVDPPPGKSRSQDGQRNPEAKLPEPHDTFGDT